jgi:hypothetical protein
MKRLFPVLLIFLAFPLFGLRSGEKLSFNIKYGLITAGSATLEVRDTTYQDTVRAWVFSSRARTNSVFDGVYMVRDHIESVWDRDRKVSVRFTKRLHEGRYRQWRVHEYNPGRASTYYQRYNYKKSRMSGKTLRIPAETQDILSAFYMVRMMDLKPGDTPKFKVTVDGKSYRATVIVHRRETVKTIFGKRSCLVIEPLLEGESLFKQTGRILIFITDDAAKIPVRMESEITFGKFVAVISEAHNVP